MRLTVSVLFAILGFGIGLLRESSRHRLFASVADKHAQLDSTTGAPALPHLCCRPSAHMHAQGTHWRLRGRHARRAGRLPLDPPHAQAPHRHLGVPRHWRCAAHRLLCVCRAPAAQPLLTSLRASQSSASASRPTRRTRARHARGAATSPVCPPCASALHGICSTPLADWSAPHSSQCKGNGLTTSNATSSNAARALLREL